MVAAVRTNTCSRARANGPQPSSGRYGAEMDLVGMARSLQPLVRAHADEGERERRLSRPVRDAMAAQGLFRMAAPAVYGGGEVSPDTMIRALEAISEADGATGWT